MNKKMITGIIIAALMVICLFPAIALADDGAAGGDNTQAVQSPQSTDITQSAGDITSLDNTISSSNTITASGTYPMSSYANGDTVTINSSLTVTLSGSSSATYTNFQIVCNPGVNLTLSNVKIDDSANSGVCPLKFNGTGNTLTLAAGTSSTLKGGENNPAVCANLCLSLDTVLTINGTGTLDATGGDKAPGIGSGGNSGKINISGGTITARGGSMAAGIGTGDSDSSVSYPGDINITGGTVYAYGGFGSAGIGGGYADYGSIMSITGGTVFACRGENGTFDIGSGYSSTTGIGSCAISDPAAVFVQHDSILALTTSTAHCTYSAGTAAVCGITMPSGWTGAFGAYLHICKVSYNTQGASTTPPDKQGIFGHSVTLSDGSGVNLNGKVFDKWNTKSDGTGTSYTGGASYTISADTTLYAIYKEKITSNGTYSLGGDGFKSGDIVTIAGGLTVTLNGNGLAFTNMCILCGDNVRLTLSNVNIDDSTTTVNDTSLMFGGGANTLSLASGTSNTLKGTPILAAVFLSKESDLTINGSGSLTAMCGGKGMGIGGYGDIYIESGVITATGSGAGIGCVDSSNNTGTIEITGGTVYAASGDSGLYDIGAHFFGGNESGETDISGTAQVFLKHDTVYNPKTSTHTHSTFPAGTHAVYGTGMPSDWTASFGAYLHTCTVTYNANGGSGAPSPLTQYYNTTGAVSSGDGMTRTNYYLTGWNTIGDGTGTAYALGSTYKFTDNITLYAQWHRPMVTVVSSNAAFGSVSGGGVYNVGADVTVTAATNAGYYFFGWYNGDTIVSSDATYKFTATKDITLTARFATYINITVSSGNAAYGSVSGGGSFLPGTSVTLTATAVAGYYFTGWYNGATLVSLSSAYTFSAAADTSLTAQFDKVGIAAAITASSSAYNKITVKWSAAPGAKGYYIYRSTTADGTYKKIGTSKKTSYVNSGVTTGTTYYYKVAAYSKTSTCKYYSDVASAASALGKVTKVTVKSSYPTKAVIKWKAVTGAKKYQVLRSDTRDGVYTAVKTTSSKTITDTGLIPGSTYYYKVVAYRGSAYSVDSDIVSVTTKAVK